MKLVIGGYAQGKLNYAVHRYGLKECRIWDGEIPRGIKKQGEITVIHHLQDWVKESLLKGGCPEEEVCELLENDPDCVIISNEIGNGIVPIDAFEREYRERMGRILVELAERAEEVVRVICGIGQKIK